MSYSYHKLYVTRRFIFCSCYPPEVDEEEKHPIHDVVQDEFNDIVDEDANDYCKSMEKDQYKSTIENGIKWMSEECFLAFTKSAENNHSEVCQSSLFIFFV